MKRIADTRTRTSAALFIRGGPPMPGLGNALNLKVPVEYDIVQTI